jgi:NAD(P)H-hydrate epimerase
MKAVTTEQIRALDQAAIEEYEIPGEELMQRAGRGVAGLVGFLADRARFDEPFIQLIAGRGNNGGDTFAAARFLREDGFDVEVLLAGAASEVRGDALRHLGKMRSAGVELHELPTHEDWDDEIANPASVQILVDGVLGVGVKGPPRGPVAGAIHYINNIAENALVVSIDVPSGLDADTGTAPGEAVVADLTACIGLPKVGLLRPEGLGHVGNAFVVPIGLASELVDAAPSSLDLITDWDLKPLLRRRRRDAHKGDFGHVLVVGGAAGYTGAPALAARGASRVGAGLVSALVPAGLVSVVAGGMPEVMTHGGPETETGSLAAGGWAGWRDRLAAFQAVACGPGMTRHRDTAEWVEHLLAECRAPLVLDADALNVLEGRATRLRKAAGPVVITPHPGELARLLGSTTAQVQADRHAAAREAAERTGAVVVLKGAGTLVAAPGRTLAVNLTGNPGMAAGGMGDVLTGMLAGLLAQGMPPFEAACTAVYLHGSAGDVAALRRSQAGMTAADVIDEIPYAFRDITAR